MQAKSKKLKRNQLITIFGASGFLGSYITRSLAKQGYRIRAAVRNPGKSQHLQPLGSVGQVHAIQANIRHPWTIERAIEGSDFVINLVGIMHENSKQHFESLHYKAIQSIVEGSQKSGIASVLHVSALGADEKSNSNYSRTKALGEKVLLSELPDSIILRPSVIFDQNDRFFNKFASISSISPFLPLIHGGNSKFQPVFAGDIAKAVENIIGGKAKPGTIYELGGPEIETFKQLMERTLKEIRKKRILLPIPTELARIKASFFELFPKPILTNDQINLLEHDNIVSEEAKKQKRTLADLDVQPTNMDAVLSTYLWRYRPHGQYNDQVSA